MDVPFDVLKIVACYMVKHKMKLSNWIIESRINWHLLSKNKNAIDLLEDNLNKIDWNELSLNQNAIDLLEKNLDKINWNYLSINPNAIHLLEANPDKINWHLLSGNHNTIHFLDGGDEHDEPDPKKLHIISQVCETTVIIWQYHTIRFYCVVLRYKPSYYKPSYYKPSYYLLIV